MGNNSSQYDEDGSSQQVQPVFRPHSEPILLPQHHPGNTSHTSGNNHLNNNRNNHNYNKNGTNGAKTGRVTIPHNYEAIIKSSDDKSSPQKLYEQLHAGIFLNGRKIKYWVKGNNNINCFMVYANGLEISWAEDQRHWLLHNIETSDGEITVAVLRNVTWLEVHGKLHTSNLTPGITYQVAYIIMVEETAFGLRVPVNFRLTLPNGTKKEHKENLTHKPREEWVRIPIGEFKASPENLGEIECSLYEFQGGNWKKGLVIQGVIIEPLM